MNSSKIAITLECPSRSGCASEEVCSRVEFGQVKEKLERLNHSLLTQECSKLKPEYEKALAKEGLGANLSEWPEY